MTLPLFLIPVLVGLLTQFSKRFFNQNWKSTMTANGYQLPRYGGMPSAHTSFACSLATLVLLVDGIASTNFAIVAALVIFILDDALRMRVYVGGHGQALMRIIRDMPAEKQREFPPLEQHLGHTPTEVIAGACVGIITTLLLYQIWI